MIRNGGSFAISYFYLSPCLNVCPGHDFGAINTIPHHFKVHRMKRYLLLSVAIFGVFVYSFATVHTIVVADYSFTPRSVNAYPGDTILWSWSNGTHTTTSVTIPTGAATWNSNMNSTSTSFMYVPAILGTYNYECTIHASMGMTGSFTVVSNTGINAVSSSRVISVYPNPASTVLHVQFNSSADLPVSFTITDMNGKTVVKKKFRTLRDRDIDLQSIPNGNYVIYATQGNEAFQQQFVIAH